jgi:hypothetical protein
VSLGDILKAEKARTGFSLGDLTVLSPQNDPYRLDTPANHQKAKWFRDAMELVGRLDGPSTIHNRGIYYAFVGEIALPDGEPFINNDDCYRFVVEASNIARWLGYVPWSKIVDERSEAPVVKIRDQGTGKYYVDVPALDSTDIDIDDLLPTVRADLGEPRQTYRLALYGEKTSLRNVLEPISDEYGADLFLSSGEISNSHLATMAEAASEDGRELVLAVFADCDPAGYQMAVSIGHKLRALRDSLYSNSFSFRVIAPALTVEQVKELGLPSTPLKATESRASGWYDRYRIEQTEIDALATLRPELFEAIVREALDPYFDHGLAERHSAATARWHSAAQYAFEDTVNPSQVADLWGKAQEHLTSLRLALAEMDSLSSSRTMATMPAWVAPRSVASGDGPMLVSSDMPLAMHAGILRRRKDYSAAA